MESKRVKRKLAAIVSMDVKGYSRLMAQDDVSCVQSLKECRKLVREKIIEYNGRVVDSPGDNLLSEFSSVNEAVECAVIIQKALLARNKELAKEQKMEFRIGVNLGDVIEDDEQIYGDGINLAARLEGLAEPGGICISGSAYDQVKNKLPLGYKYMGEKKVKNIPDPVSVYYVLPESKYEGKLIYHHKHDNPRLKRVKRGMFVCLIILLLFGGFLGRSKFSNHPEPPAPVKKLRDKIMQLRLPDKPSLAVLPFMNLSGDLEQEYFSDGMTEDLITDLSKVSGLFVISRNSVFSYKGKNVKVEKISRELGVRYILEGSVRKVEDRVRITAQLIDATTGGHVWAQRYDRELKDIFSVQDEVIENIVANLAVKLTQDDEKRLKKDVKIDLQAYDYYLRGMELHAKKFQDGFEKARALFAKAIEIDPLFARAYAAMGHNWVMQWIFGNNPDPEYLRKAMELGEKTLSIDPEESSGHALIAMVYLWTKENDKAILESMKALNLDPNNAQRVVELGENLIWGGRPQEGITYVQKAIRLDPNYPSWYLWNLGHAYFLMSEFDRAIDAFDRSLQSEPSFWPSHLYRAMSYDKLGDKEKVAQFVKETKEMDHKLSMKDWERKLPYKDPGLSVELFRRIKEIGIQD